MRKLNTRQLEKLMEIFDELPKSRPEPRFAKSVARYKSLNSAYLTLRSSMPNATFPQIRFHLTGGSAVKCLCGNTTVYGSKGYKPYCSLQCQIIGKVAIHNTRQEEHNKRFSRSDYIKQLSKTSIKQFKYVFSKYGSGAIERKILDELCENYHDLYEIYLKIPAKNARARRMIATGQLQTYKACASCGIQLVAERDRYYDHCNNRECFKEANARATKATLQSRYGTTCISKISGHKEKCQRTTMERYGVSHHTKSEETKQSIQKTCLRRYGVPSSNQDKAVHTKQKAGRYTKKSVNIGGKTFNLLGYEPQALTYILQKSGLKLSAIKTSTEDIPKIQYKLSGKIHAYFPDFYIPSRNLLIEVKSVWTLIQTRSCFNRVLAKAKACTDAGFNFKLLVMAESGRRVPLPSTVFYSGYASTARFLKSLSSRA